MYLSSIFKKLIEVLSTSAVFEDLDLQFCGLESFKEVILYSTKMNCRSYFF